MNTGFNWCFQWFHYWAFMIIIPHRHSALLQNKSLPGEAHHKKGLWFEHFLIILSDKHLISIVWNEPGCFVITKQMFKQPDVCVCWYDLALLGVHDLDKLCPEFSANVYSGLVRETVWSQQSVAMLGNQAVGMDMTWQCWGHCSTVSVPWPSLLHGRMESSKSSPHEKLSSYTNYNSKLL